MKEETLRDIWVRQGWNSTDLASKANITVPTLYKMNQKDGGVSFRIVERVCHILGLLLDEYASLPVCPKSERYKKEKKS